MMIKSLLLTIAISVGTAYEAPRQNQHGLLKINYEQILQHNAACDLVAIDLHASLCKKIIGLAINDKTKFSLIDYSYYLYLNYINGITSVHYVQHLKINEREILWHYSNLPKRFPTPPQQTSSKKTKLIPTVRIPSIDTREYNLAIAKMTRSIKE